MRGGDSRGRARIPRDETGRRNCVHTRCPPTAWEGCGPWGFLTSAAFFRKHTCLWAPQVLPVSLRSPGHTPCHRDTDRNSNSENWYRPEHYDTQPSSPHHKPSSAPFPMSGSSGAKSHGPGTTSPLPVQGGILFPSEPGAHRTDPMASNKTAAPFNRWVNRGPRLHHVLANCVHVTPMGSYTPAQRGEPPGTTGVVPTSPRLALGSLTRGGGWGGWHVKEGRKERRWEKEREREKDEEGILRLRKTQQVSLGKLHPKLFWFLSHEVFTKSQSNTNLVLSGT